MSEVKTVDIKQLDGTIKTIENPICCGMLEYINEEYPYPIEQPLNINFSTGQMDVSKWFIRLNKLTKSGKISEASENRSLVRIEYCPFCGKKLEYDDKEKGENK